CGFTSRSMTPFTSSCDRLCTWSRLSHSSAAAANLSAATGFRRAGFSPLPTALLASCHTVLRQAEPRGQRHDLIAMSERRRACRHDQAAVRLARGCNDGALDLADVAYVDPTRFHPKRRRCGLDGPELPDSEGYGGTPKDGHSFDPRYDAAEDWVFA